MKKVYIDVKVRMIVRTEEGVGIDDIISEMDYDFTSQTEGADIEDTEIQEYRVIDSK